MVQGKNWLKCGVFPEKFSLRPVLNPIYILNQHIPPPKAIKSHSTSLDTFCGWPSFLHWILTLWLLAIYRHKKNLLRSVRFVHSLVEFGASWVCTGIRCFCCLFGVIFHLLFALVLLCDTKPCSQALWKHILERECETRIRDWTPAICATIVAAACRCSSVKWEEV